MKLFVLLKRCSITRERESIHQEREGEREREEREGERVSFSTLPSIRVLEGSKAPSNSTCRMVY